MILDVLAQALVIVGCALIALAGIGVVRLGDVLARLHAMSKASALGILLVLSGAALSVDNADDVTSLVLAAILQLMTLPVAVTLISRAAYGAGEAVAPVDTVDELARDEAGRIDP